MTAVSNLQDEIKGIELSVISRAQGESAEVESGPIAPTVPRESRPKRRKKMMDSNIEGSDQTAEASVAGEKSD